MKKIALSVLLVGLLIILGSATAFANSPVLLDGEFVDVETVAVDGRTLLPVRAMVETLGGDVDWNAGTRQATVVHGNTTIVLTIGSTAALVNGTTVTLDVPAQTINGRTFLPLRFVGESLGLDIDFYAQTVIISTPANTLSEADLRTIARNAAAAHAAATPTPQPQTGPGPRIFAGSGDDVISLDPFPVDYVFVISGNEAGRHFAVHAHGARRNLLVNTTSPYKGITFVENQDTETLEITAVGDWTIEQRALSEMRTISSGQTIIGTGDEILQILSHGSTATVEGNSEGRHFAVLSHGTRRNLLVNTTSEYSGRVMLRGTYTILEITAVGDWSITFD